MGRVVTGVGGNGLMRLSRLLLAQGRGNVEDLSRLCFLRWWICRGCAAVGAGASFFGGCGEGKGG